MANMSYCRFENTKSDLKDCINALENREINSEEEKVNARRMIINFLDFCLNEGIIEDFEGERIQQIISECK